MKKNIRSTESTRPRAIPAMLLTAVATALTIPPPNALDEVGRRDAETQVARPDLRGVDDLGHRVGKRRDRDREDDDDDRDARGDHAQRGHRPAHAPGVQQIHDRPQHAAHEQRQDDRRGEQRHDHDLRDQPEQPERRPATRQLHWPSRSSQSGTRPDIWIWSPLAAEDPDDRRRERERPRRSPAPSRRGRSPRTAPRRTGSRSTAIAAGIRVPDPYARGATYRPSR